MKAAGRYAIGLLIEEAWDCYGNSRYADGLGAAQRAIDGARQLGDLTLQVRATEIEGDCLRMLGDISAALVRYTWLLGVGQDPRFREQLRSDDVTVIIATAYANWVLVARQLSEIPASKLFEVLDAGEAWLRAVGHVDWRAGLLSERAVVCGMLGRLEEAVAYLQEAVALERRHPGPPGYTLATYLSSLGDALHDVGRVEEAQTAYEQAYEASTGAFGRNVALQGLARIALDRGDVALARRHAEEAVQLAEGMGADTLCGALQALVDVHRAADETAAAWTIIERLLPLERRLGGSGLYWALGAAADVALDRGEAATARQYLEEAAPLARALDHQCGLVVFEDEINERRQRLEALDSSS